MKATFVFAAAASAMCWLAQALPSNSSHSTTTAVSSNATSSDSGVVSGKHFDRVFIIVFENKDYSTAMKDKYLKTLPQRHNGRAINYLKLCDRSSLSYTSIF